MSEKEFLQAFARVAKRFTVRQGSKCIRERAWKNGHRCPLEVVAGMRSGSYSEARRALKIRARVGWDIVEAADDGVMNARAARIRAAMIESIRKTR